LPLHRYDNTGSTVIHSLKKQVHKLKGAGKLDTGKMAELPYCYIHFSRGNCVSEKFPDIVDAWKSEISVTVSVIKSLMPIVF
jgi:hypothetical protein